jgi:hypothetical protein
MEVSGHINPVKERAYPLNRMLGGPQGRSGSSGEEKNVSSLPAIRPRIFQPLVYSLYWFRYAGYHLPWLPKGTECRMWNWLLSLIQFDVQHVELTDAALYQDVWHCLIYTREQLFLCRFWGSASFQSFEVKSCVLMFIGLIEMRFEFVNTLRNTLIYLECTQTKSSGTPYIVFCSVLRNVQISFNTGANKYRNCLTTGAPLHETTQAIYFLCPRILAQKMQTSSGFS